MSNPDDNRIQEFLSAYLDDELTPEEKAGVEGKLQASPALVAQLEKLRLLRKTVAMEDIPAPPPGLIGQIKNRLPAGTATAPRLRKRRRFNIVPLAAAAMVVIGVIAGGIYLDSHGQLGELFRHTAVKDQVPLPSAPGGEEEAGAEAAREKLKALSYIGTAPAPGGEAGAPPPGPATEPPAPAPEPSAADRQEAQPPQEAGRGFIEPQAGELAAGAKQEESPADSKDFPARAALQAAPPQPAQPVGMRTWTPPGTGMLQWSVAPPEDPALILGQMAEEQGGRGLLQAGPPRAVRITVPRESWSRLLAALRARGVGGTTTLPAPPEEVDRVTLVVAAPSLAR